MSEKRKKSWKEIDAQRDRSQHRRPEPPQGGPGPRGRDPSRSYRTALDELFSSGAVGKLVEKRDEETGVKVETDAPRRKELAAVIEAASGPDQRQAAIDAYRAAFGLPRDFETLAYFLEQADPDRVEEAMARIGELLDSEKPKRGRTLVAKLKAVAELSEWGRLRRGAQALLDRL
ncbi:MAG: hypothetical protein RBU30_26460 [Polyangia bacterium]|jgi:hypothetical protein|nr:hypothetical protein [Polyangia bacterium]